MQRNLNNPMELLLMIAGTRVEVENENKNTEASNKKHKEASYQPSSRVSQENEDTFTQTPASHSSGEIRVEYTKLPDVQVQLSTSKLCSANYISPILGPRLQKQDEDGSDPVRKLSL